MGRVMALYVWSIVSFCFPLLVDVSAFRMLSVRFALLVLVLICSEYVNFGSNVRPRIFGRICVGIILLLTSILRVSLYSAECGVKSVAVVLSELMHKLFSLAQLVTVFMYGYSFCCAIL